MIAQQVVVKNRPPELQIRVKHKIVFLGNQFVGKTSIIERFIYNHFDEKTQPTVGIDFLAKTVKIEEQDIRLLLWDTAGQERFHSLIPSYLRDASCAIIVYDITCLKSFEGVDNWYKKVRQTRGSEALIVLLGNKVDAEDKRQVKYEDALQYAQDRDIMFFEVSAKLASNVEQVFNNICVSLPADNSFIQASKCLLSFKPLNSHRLNLKRPLSNINYSNHTLVDLDLTQKLTKSHKSSYSPHPFNQSSTAQSSNDKQKLTSRPMLLMFLVFLLLLYTRQFIYQYKYQYILSAYR